MQKNNLLIALAFMGIAACKSNDKTEPTTTTDNPMNAAQNFIRATLDGKFDEAKEFILQDSLNLNYLEVGQRSRQNASQDVKDGYRTASIRVHTTFTQNDSTTVVVYSNSFKNDHDTLKIVKQNNQWLVDLKYLFEHGKDSLLPKPVSIDSLK